MRPSDLDIWILAGQSNMQGCGLLEGVLAPDDRVWTLTSAGNWEIGCEPLHRLWESYTSVHGAFMRAGMSPEDNARDDAHYAALDAQNRTTGSGLGIAFGKAMADATGRPVGLVPAAHGGTSLEQWSQNLKSEGGASLYGGMLDRTKRALEGGGTLRGMLWYQGESDAFEGAAETYLERMTAWIEAARADLGAPDLPVYVVQIGNVFHTPAEEAAGQGWQGKSWELVREALLELPQRVPHTGVAPAIDLSLVDAIHIDTPGLIRLGQRLARLALGKPSPRMVRIEPYTFPHGAAGVRVVCEGVTGGWNPRTHIAGFGVRAADGSIHQNVMVLNADAEAANPSNILLLLNTKPSDEVSIGYGLGLKPYVNATDDADMALPAFMAVPLG